jgi:hypothetical protein
MHDAPGRVNGQIRALAAVTLHRVVRRWSGVVNIAKEPAFFNLRGEKAGW